MRKPRAQPWASFQGYERTCAPVTQGCALGCRISALQAAGIRAASRDVLRVAIDEDDDGAGHNEGNARPAQRLWRGF